MSQPLISTHRHLGVVCASLSWLQCTDNIVAIIVVTIVVVVAIVVVLSVNSYQKS